MHTKSIISVALYFKQGHFRMFKNRSNEWWDEIEGRWGNLGGVAAIRLEFCEVALECGEWVSWDSPGPGARGQEGLKGHLLDLCQIRKRLVFISTSKNKSTFLMQLHSKHTFPQSNNRKYFGIPIHTLRTCNWLTLFFQRYTLHVIINPWLLSF